MLQIAIRKACLLAWVFILKSMNLQVVAETNYQQQAGLYQAGVSYCFHILLYWTVSSIHLFFCSIHEIIELFMLSRGLGLTVSSLFHTYIWIIFQG